MTLDIKQRKTSLLSTTPDNLDNKEDPKRDILDLHRKEKKTRTPEKTGSVGVTGEEEGETVGR